MYSLKDRINEIDDTSRVSSVSAVTRVSGTKQVSGTKSVTPSQEPEASILAAKRRRNLHPFFFHMGPVALSLTSVLLIGLMAVLYLSQVGQGVSANQRLQSIQAQQNDLQRQDQDLVNTISNEQSPAYIASQARKMGLVPVDPNAVQVVKAKNLKPIPGGTQEIQP